MIRAIRPSAMAQDDAALIAGWNISPNLAYTVSLSVSASAVVVLLADADNSGLIGSGLALVGADQPVTIMPMPGQTIGMVDADLGWHLLVTTTGTEGDRTIRIGPAVDLPDEIHPVYADDNMALARATAAINAGAYYVDDVSVACPLGLGAGIGAVTSVPVDGAAVVGQVESVTWSGTPDGTIETAVIRRHTPIAPEAYEPPLPPPILVDDTAETDAVTAASGNVLANDTGTLAVVAVNGLSANVGEEIAGSNGGVFVIGSDGSWTFDPRGDFSELSGADTATTSVSYHATNGEAEGSAILTVTVGAASVPTDPLWAYVSLCINPTGGDGSTTITDAKGATLAIGTGIEIDTDALGVPAILNTGANGIIATNAAVIPRGTEDFCIEALLRKTSSPIGYETLIEAPVSGGLQIYFGQVQGQIRLGRYAVDFQVTTPLSSLPVGSLKHLAVTRNGSTFRIFVDGVQVSSATASPSYATPITQTIMLNLKALSRGIRITRGHYRYNSNFTPPSLPFPTA